MKKFYSFVMAALLGAFAANAQLNFATGTPDKFTKVAAGGTVVCDKGQDDGVELIYDPEIWVESTLAMKNLRVVIKSPNTIQFCGDGNCKNITSITADKMEVGPGKPRPLLIEYKPADDKFEPFDVEVTASNPLDPESAVTCKIHFGEASTSINEVNGSGNEILFSAGHLNYNVNGVATVKIYTILGEQVLSTTVKGQGSIDLSTLGKGAYIYQASGALKASGKFLRR